MKVVLKAEYAVIKGATAALPGRTELNQNKHYGSQYSILTSNLVLNDQESKPLPVNITKFKSPVELHIIIFL
jgi:hypothetical protein